MTSHTLNELIAEGVRGRYILVRSDLNVPLDGSTVTDDGRIKASLPVLKKLSDAGARVLVTAHLGRPKGAPEEKYSLKPAATRLAELADFNVQLAADTVGDSAKELAAALQDGEVLILENVRFDARETSKNDAERGAFADELVALTGDNGAFVDDAFGAVHRKHASVYDVATRLPSFQGDLVHTEVDEQFAGRGYASALARTALDYARANNLKVIPTCPFVRKYLERHPEYDDLRDTR